MPHGNGRCALCNGTTMSTATAASATSPQPNVMPARIALCSRPVTRSIEMRGNATQDAGAGRPGTGRQPPPSRSIRSGIASSARPHQKSSFPVRSAHLLSRPDLAPPRRGTQRRGLGREERTKGAEPPAATRSEVSMARWRAPDLPRSEYRGILNLTRSIHSGETARQIR